ncbi:MAG: hypothetical protein IMY73_02145 [Bacteroidetes bacterium]|nr:hypothetical protein [Bacteroidota bacterium]
MSAKITLDSLIERGNSIMKCSLIFDMSNKNEYNLSVFKYFYIDWKFLVIRFLGEKNKEDKVILEFKEYVDIFEKNNSYENFYSLLSILRALKCFPQKQL